MLKVSSVQVTISSVQVLRGFSLDLAAGQMVSLVGRNGAGKTSLMRTVMGHLPASGGSVHFEDVNLANVARHARAGLGIGYMPEDRGLVPELTVEENILVPVWVSKRLKAEERLKFVYEILPELHAIRDTVRCSFPVGSRKWPRSRARWQSARACCCWTNPSRASHPRSRSACRKWSEPCAAPTLRC